MASRRENLASQRVVLVEDDRWESNYVKQLIKKAFPSALVEQLYTEAEFHTAMPKFVARPPAAVMDIALPLGDIDL
jgi:hypothetical protein